MQVQVQQEEDGQGTCLHRLRGGETSPHPNGSSGNGFRDSGQLNKCWRRGCCCRRRWDSLGRCCCGYVRARAESNSLSACRGLRVRDACMNEQRLDHTQTLSSFPTAQLKVKSLQHKCLSTSPTFGTSQCSCAAGVSPRHPVSLHFTHNTVKLCNHAIQCADLINTIISCVNRVVLVNALPLLY
jgi:hypothetical protein